MFINPANEIIGDANVSAPPPHIGKNVDIAAHWDILKCSALGSSPRVTAGGWGDIREYRERQKSIPNQALNCNTLNPHSGR